MGTNKERIEQLEEGLHRMELSMDDRLLQVEEYLNCLSDVLLANPGNPILGSITNREGNGGERLVVSSKTAKLEFPRFSGDDPTEWFNHVNQFFEFQNTPEAQKVSLASYHLEGEANQWWQWIHRTFQEEGRVLSWMNFEDELWARFGPSECEDYLLFKTCSTFSPEEKLIPVLTVLGPIREVLKKPMPTPKSSTDFIK